MLSTYIQVENPQARAMVKKVICVSILMMIVVIIQSIIAFADSSSIIANINNGGGGIGTSSSGPTIHGGFRTFNSRVLRHRCFQGRGKGWGIVGIENNEHICH